MILKKLIQWGREKSPWLYHLSTGSCNGCDIEVLAAVTPLYDPERLGALLKGSPRHADVVLVTGCVSKKNFKRFKRVLDQVPRPRVVVAIGSCPNSGGIYRGSYAVDPPLDKHIRVDAYVPGCPPRPEAIIDGVVKAMENMK